MKKSYMMPAMQANEAQVQTMVALSLVDGTADPNEEVLTKENLAWDIWGKEDAE